MSTNVFSAKDIQRKWRLFDAKNKPLGRFSVEVAKALMGKDKPAFVPYLDMGDYVVVINAKDIKTSGKKEAQKKYVRHSGYPGGLKVQTLSQVRAKKPEKVVFKAISGMVPGTKLGKKIVKKLHVFAGSEHPYEKNLKSPSLNVKTEEGGEDDKK